MKNVFLVGYTHSLRKGYTYYKKSYKIIFYVLTNFFSTTHLALFAGWISEPTGFQSTWLPFTALINESWDSVNFSEGFAEAAFSSVVEAFTEVFELPESEIQFCKFFNLTLITSAHCIRKLRLPDCRFDNESVLVLLKLSPLLSTSLWAEIVILVPVPVTVKFVLEPNNIKQ